MEKQNNSKSHSERFGEGVQFQRIRRITGYLVGTMEQWNNAKRAEERDRVKHGLKFVDVLNKPAHNK